MKTQLLFCLKMCTLVMLPNVILARVLPAPTKGGYGDYALALMTATTQRSWYNMIRSGSSITMSGRRLNI